MGFDWLHELTTNCLHPRSQADLGVMPTTVPPRGRATDACYLGHRSHLSRVRLLPCVNPAQVVWQACFPIGYLTEWRRRPQSLPNSNPRGSQCSRIGFFRALAASCRFPDRIHPIGASSPLVYGAVVDPHSELRAESAAAPARLSLFPRAQSRHRRIHRAGSEISFPRLNRPNRKVVSSMR